jgi:hypothetical protein
MTNYISYPDYFKEITNSKDDNNFRLVDGKQIHVLLEDLFSSQYSLIKPMPITIDYSDGYYVIIQEGTNMSIDSPNLFDAYKKLAHVIVKLYRRLNSNVPKLGPYPKNVLNYLKKYIQD